MSEETTDHDQLISPSKEVAVSVSTANISSAIYLSNDLWSITFYLMYPLSLQYETEDSGYLEIS